MKQPHELIDDALRRVPAFAFDPAFSDCLLPPEAVDVRPGSVPRQLDEVAMPEWKQLVATRLRERRAKAASDDASTAFLCDALAHFLDAIPAREHPLLVALYLRSLARARGTETEPSALALAMDQYSAMLVRDELGRDDER